MKELSKEGKLERDLDEACGLLRKVIDDYKIIDPCGEYDTQYCGLCGMFQPYGNPPQHEPDCIYFEIQKFLEGET